VKKTRDLLIKFFFVKRLEIIILVKQDFCLVKFLKLFKKDRVDFFFFQKGFFFFKLQRNQEEGEIFCLFDNFLLITNEITRVAGIEPTHMVLKTIVLPLNYTPWDGKQDFHLYGYFFYNIFQKKMFRLFDFRSPLLTISQLIFKLKLIRCFPSL
jgi:hypothetical protein